MRVYEALANARFSACEVCIESGGGPHVRIRDKSKPPMPSGVTAALEVARRKKVAEAAPLMSVDVTCGQRSLWELLSLLLLPEIFCKNLIILNTARTLFTYFTKS